MDEASRMMHYPQNYGMQQQMGGEVVQQQPTSPPPTEEASLGGTQEGTRGTANINTILDQIMNITDQSLDEAQVTFLCSPLLGQTYHTSGGKVIFQGEGGTMGGKIHNLLE